jgi:hypothetical protein
MKSNSSNYKEVEEEFNGHCQLSVSESKSSQVSFFPFLITQNEAALVGLSVSAVCRITWKLSSKISVEEQHGVNTGCQSKAETKDPFALHQ